MKKLFSMLLIGSTILVKCADHDISPLHSTPSTQSTCYLATIKDSNDIYTYSYDANRRVTGINGTEIGNGTTNYNEYATFDENHHLTKLALCQNGNCNTYDLSYNADGHVIEEIFTPYNASKLKTEYAYNESGQRSLRKFYFFDPSTEQYVLNSYSVIIYPDNKTTNISEIKYYDPSDNLWFDETFTYDDKKCPYLNNYFYHLYEKVTTNNVIKKVSTRIGYNVLTSNYSYTYNENGYPLTVVETTDSGTNQMSYSYTNCK